MTFIEILSTNATLIHQYIIMGMVGISAIIYTISIVFAMKALKKKSNELKLTQQQHAAKIDLIREDNDKKMEKIRVEMLKKEEERGRQWMESEKETLHVLNGVSMLLDLNDKIGRGDTEKVLTILRAIEEKIKSNLDDGKKIDASEKKYRALFENLVLGVALHEIITDENGNPINYKFLEVNKAFESLTGLKGEEIIGKTFTDVLPKTESFWIETYGKVALTGKPTKFENFSDSLGKCYQVVAYSPEPNKFATIFTDITNCKQSINP